MKQRKKTTFQNILDQVDQMMNVIIRGGRAPQKHPTQTALTT